MLTNYFITVISTVLLFLPYYAGAETAVNGIYQKVPGYEFQYDGKAVEVIEFLSFYCDRA